MRKELIFEGGKNINGKIRHLLLNKVWNENDVLVHYEVTTDQDVTIEIVLDNDGNWIEKDGAVTALSAEMGKLIDDYI